MRTVVIESPFEGGTEREADNVEYALRCMADALRNGEAPFLSHLIYPRLLDDTVPDQRTLGLKAGHAIAARLEIWAVYLDRGITPGMLQGIDAAVAAGFRPWHEAFDGGAYWDPQDRVIVFRTFDTVDAEKSTELMLHDCARWGVLLAHFEQLARQNWDLPRRKR